jgi:hypothetical protein
MKIAIIGGGWVGCHLAYKLKDKHDITLYEKNENLFTETSYKNQNRLHIGFHYARNYKTREMCRDTFSRFMSDYSFLTNEVGNNIYCVPNKGSLIDYQTYLQIFSNFDKEISNLTLDSTNCCIKTNERHINFKLAHNFFNTELSNLKVNASINTKKLNKLSNVFDLVINATNNQIKNIDDHESFYELTITLIYKKINNTQFDALTLVDGNLFSIYPYHDNYFTVTDVEFTPIKKFKTIKQLTNFSKKIDESFILDRINKIENKIKKFYPEFNNYFMYDSYILSTKSKIISSSDERYPIITKNKNVINCFTGKIQGIYIIEDYIYKEIKLNE